MKLTWNRPIRTLLPSLFILIPCASAQTYEVSVMSTRLHISKADLGSISEEDKKDDDTKLRGHTGLGVRVTWNTKGYYGHELGFTKNRATLTTAMRETVGKVVEETVLEDRIIIENFWYNFLLYMMPRGERFRPFISFGGQMHRYGKPRFEEWTRERVRSYGVNYGIGLKIRLFKYGLLRLDMRDHIGGKPFDLEFEEFSKTGGIMRQQEYSAGVGLTF